MAEQIVGRRGELVALAEFLEALPATAKEGDDLVHGARVT